MSKLEGISGQQLGWFVEQIERLENEKAALGADIRRLFDQAKGAGFDTKIMRQVVKLKRIEAAGQVERGSVLELYNEAVDIGVLESWF